MSRRAHGNSTPTRRDGRPAGPPLQVYLRDSKRPLTILVFLTPLIIAYELGLVLALRSETGVLTNKAHESLLRFFDIFGVPARSGLYLGGVVILVVLLLWHVLNRDRWRISGRTLLGMTVETVALTAPLLAIAQIIARLGETTIAPVAAVGLTSVGLAASPGADPAAVNLADLDLSARLAISVGAGLYEELLFRMILIAALHTILVDIAGLKSAAGAATAIVISAVAFAFYHDATGPDGSWSWRLIAFYVIAGVYFGVLYVGRGFGIVVGVHALYDIVTASFLMGPPAHGG